MKQIALLRGINVGGKNKLPMRVLAALFVEAGCTDVQTYIQSGNVVFDAPAKLDVPALVSKSISIQLGLSVPVVVRTAAELAEVVAANPFKSSREDLETRAVLFLAGRPPPAAIARLDPLRSPPDEFAVRGGEIYLLCPNGFARTKLSNDYFDRKLATISTGRNWRTVLKLAELSS